MSTRLTDLSNELLLQIIDFLLIEDVYEDNEDEKTIDEREHSRKRSDSWSEGTHMIAGDDQTNIQRQAWRTVARADPTDHNSVDETVPVISKVSHYDGMGDYSDHNVGKASVLSLSRTCMQLYRLLSPRLFHTIRMRDARSSAEAIESVYLSAQAQHVKRLEFHCDGPLVTVGDLFSPYYAPIDALHLEDVYDCLKKLSKFPNLESLNLDFGFFGDAKAKRLDSRSEEESSDEDRDSDVEWDEAEGAIERLHDMIQTEEESYGWKAIMSKVFNAVIDSGANIRHLDFRSCPIRPLTLFESDRFHWWLANLESFRFEVNAHFVNKQRCTSLIPTYSSHISNLDNYFFNHLTKVKQLALIGSRQGALGQICMQQSDSSPSLHVPLKESHMPHLKLLELGYYFMQEIGGDIIDFLIAHSDTLEVCGPLSQSYLIPADGCRQHLILHHCYVANPSLSHGDGYPSSIFTLPTIQKTWWSLLHRYAAAKPRALLKVTKYPYYASIVDWQWGSNCSSAQSSHELRRYMDRCYEIGKDRMVFCYAELDDRTGEVVECKGENRQSVWLGKDQEAWEELMEVVRGNRERVELEEQRRWTR